MLTRSERRRSWRRSAIGLVTVVAAVLVLAEASTRLLAPYLPEPLLYGDDATQVKVAQLENRPGGCVDVVVAGSSMGRDAFDPASFTAADTSHLSAYNASLDGATPALLQRWMLDEVEPRVKPDLVVITLASADFNVHSSIAESALDAYDAAPLTQPGVGGRAAAWITERSDLVRYRTSLRNPAAIGDAIGDRRSSTRAQRRTADSLEGLIGVNGEGESRRTLHYRHDAPTKAFARQQLLASYAIDERQVTATRALIAELRERGVQVAIVVLPVTPDYVALHPRGSEDFELFLGSVRDLATDLHVALIDDHDAAPEEDFADTHHLNGDGQRRFSESLPGELRSAGIAPARACT